jgi:hypothetical protein
MRAKDRLRKLWQPGDLSHNFSRYPHKRSAPRVDRLAGILRNGILAPASCDFDPRRIPARFRTSRNPALSL